MKLRDLVKKLKKNQEDTISKVNKVRAVLEERDPGCIPLSLEMLGDLSMDLRKGLE